MSLTPRSLKSLTAAALVTSVLLVPAVHAYQGPSQGGSKGSIEGSELGSALIVEGSVELIKAGAKFTVTAIEPSVEVGRHLITITTRVAQTGSAVAEEAAAMFAAKCVGAAQRLQVRFGKWFRIQLGGLRGTNEEGRLLRVDRCHR